MPRGLAGGVLIGNRTTQGNRSRKLRRRAPASGRIALLLAVCGLVATAWSQQAAPPAPDSVQSSMAGSIQGVVVDREGSVCQGAHVELKLTASNPPSLRTAISDSDGRYDFSAVPAGPFQLTVFSQGFTSHVISGVLHSGENYQAQQVTLLLTEAESDVRVTASQQEIAVEQLREEEQQRVLGFIPNFYVSYAPDAPPLTTGQKFRLAWKSSIDPVTFLATGFFAGIEQADGEFNGYGQGAEGYAKRYGAGFADNFTGTMIGGALLPSLLKQDPRYFYKGTGSKRSRVLYAIAMSVVCKGDHGRWQMNYSAIGGGFAAAGISNLYYPAADRSGVALTFENLGYGMAGSAVGNLFQEFVIRKLTPRLPHYSSAQR